MSSIRKTKKLLKHHDELREIKMCERNPFAPWSHLTMVQQNQVVKFTKFGITLCEDDGIPYECVPYRKITKVTFETKWWNNL